MSYMVRLNPKQVKFFYLQLSKTIQTFWIGVASIIWEKRERNEEGSYIVLYLFTNYLDHLMIFILFW